MDLELSGKAFIVTGGTNGLGLALAKTLVSEGALVAVCGRDPERLAHAANVLGGDAVVTRADVTNGDDLDHFYDESRTRFGHIDGVVNNAGRSAAGLLANSTDDEWREDYELKVLSAVHLIRRATPDLIASKGAVLNVLAIKGKAPDAGSTPTSASRAAGLALTKALAGELGTHGVRVNAVLIGLIRSGQWTRRAAAMDMDVEAFYEAVTAQQRVPLGRFGHEQEFADLAAFLLSARASYLNGVGINLDGGLSPLP